MSTALALVESAAASVAALAPDRFAHEADDSNTVVLDVREADERATTGSIARSVHVPRGLVEFRADHADAGHDPRLRPDVRVLVYCADGSRSALAADTLRRLGYTDVAHLAGGLAAWEAACLPLVCRAPSPY